MTHITTPLKAHTPEEINFERADEQGLRNWLITGIGSYGVNMSMIRAITASYAGQMDFLGCYAADFEKINHAPIKGIAPGWLEKLLKKQDNPHFRSWQLDLAQMGMGGEIKNAWNRLDETASTVRTIVEVIEKDTMKYGNHIGLYESNNSRSGGTGTTIGVLLDCMLRTVVDIDVTIETTVIPTLADRIKFENRKITLANQLSRGLPGKDLVFLTDNAAARNGITRQKLDLMNSILIEVLRNGKPIKGDNDVSDRIGTLKEDGNHLVLPAAMIKNLPLHEKGGLFKKKVLSERVLEDELKRNMSFLCTDKGFKKHGFVQARKTMPVYLIICGPLPEDIAIKAAESTAIPEDVSVLLLPASFLDNKFLIGALHVTEHSIDSIDRIYGLKPDGVRPAPTPEKLLPDGILKEYAERCFPRTDISYPDVYKRIAAICDCDVDEIMEVA